MADLWFKLSVDFPDNPKVLEAGPSAAWLYVAGLAYSRKYLTDGFIPRALVPMLARAKRPKLESEKLVAVGLWDVHPDGFLIHDYFEWNPSKEEVRATREWGASRKALYRNKELTAFIRERDDNRCRYCGVQVNWTDRRGPVGGQFDHVVPRGPSTAENVVVACRECNYKKSDKSPSECGLTLKPEPNRNQVVTSSGLNTPHVRADAPDARARSASVSDSQGVEVLEGSVRETEREARQRYGPPIVGGPLEHRSHGWCNDRGLCLPASLYSELLQRLGRHRQPEFRQWLGATIDGLGDEVPGESVWVFWRSRFEAWQGSTAPTTKAARTMAAGRRVAAMFEQGVEIDPFGLKADARAKALAEKAGA